VPVRVVIAVLFVLRRLGAINTIPVLNWLPDN